MIKNEIPYIEHNGKEYRCYQAGYVNPIQHKWQFIIKGINSNIFANSKIKFMNLEFTVTYTLRDEEQTLIQAWII
jgi:hypothetical protein